MEHSTVALYQFENIKRSTSFGVNTINCTNLSLTKTSISIEYINRTTNHIGLCTVIM